MDQERIGKFIAKMRKEQNLTQEELAEKLGITYKAVSKWECGKSLPDISIMVELCDILKISLNELFAGQHLTEKELKENSEKNILNITREEKNKRKKLNKVVRIFLIIIVGLAISLIGLFKYVSSFLTVAKTFELNWNIILPSDFKEEYYVDSGPSFHGDGERYSIFSGKNFMTQLKEEKNEELEKEFYKLFTSLNIPKDRRIDFSHKYSWIKILKEDDNSNYMYCIFDEDESKFYFYEFFV